MQSTRDSRLLSAYISQLRLLALFNELRPQPWFQKVGTEIVPPGALNSQCHPTVEPLSWVLLTVRLQDVSGTIRLLSSSCRSCGVAPSKQEVLWRHSKTSCLGAWDQYSNGYPEIRSPKLYPAPNRRTLLGEIWRPFHATPYAIGEMDDLPISADAQSFEQD